MSIAAIQSIEVDNNTLRVKFQRTLKYDSIVTNAFTLTKDVATPVVYPFKVIDLTNDYNSVSRVLNLRLDVSLTSAAGYTLAASGLRDATGNVIPNESISFIAAQADNDYLPDVPLAPDFTVEDHSILPSVFTESNTLLEGTPAEFSVVETDPADDAYYIAENYNNGLLVVKFSAKPNTMYLTDEYFVAQRRKIQRGPTRWESVDTQITVDSYRPWVYVVFPSLDLIPVYNVAGRNYFETGYKYRLKVHKSVRVGPEAYVSGLGGGFVGVQMGGPGIYDIKVYKGDDFALALQLRESTTGPYINLTGWTGRAQIRNAAGDLITAFVFTLADQTTTPGGVTIGLSAATTAALTISNGAYDVELTNTAGKVTTYLKGNVSVYSDVTRT